MNLFQLNQDEILTFFAVLIRYSTLLVVLPFFGDRMVPVPVKVLFSLAVSVAMYPVLVSSGLVNPKGASRWSQTAGSLMTTIGLEALYGLVVGYAAKLCFDALSFGANIMGNLMGFSAAAVFDPHQESNTIMVAEFYTAIAMLLFLTLDGHHLVLEASMRSYQWVGMGQMSFTESLSMKLISGTAEVFKIGFQIAAPMAVAIFTTNIAFGIMAKSMPQVNVLILSFGASALVGVFVMLVTFPEYQGVAGNIVGRMGDQIVTFSQAIGGHEE